MRDQAPEYDSPVGRGFSPPAADPDHPQKMRRYAEEHLDWSVKKLKEFLEAPLCPARRPSGCRERENGNLRLPLWVSPALKTSFEIKTFPPLSHPADDPPGTEGQVPSDPQGHARDLSAEVAGGLLCPGNPGRGWRLGLAGRKATPRPPGKVAGACRFLIRCCAGGGGLPPVAGSPAPASPGCFRVEVLQFTSITGTQVKLAFLEGLRLHAVTGA